MTMTKSKNKGSLAFENDKGRPDKKQLEIAVKTIDAAAKRLGLDAIRVKVVRHHH